MAVDTEQINARGNLIHLLSEMFKTGVTSENYGCSSNHRQRPHLIQSKETVALEFHSHNHRRKEKAFSAINDSEDTLFMHSLLHKT